VLPRNSIGQSQIVRDGSSGTAEWIDVGRMQDVTAAHARRMLRARRPLLLIGAVMVVFIAFAMRIAIEPGTRRQPVVPVPQSLTGEPVGGTPLSSPEEDEPLRDEPLETQSKPEQTDTDEPLSSPELDEKLPDEAAETPTNTPSGDAPIP